MPASKLSNSTSTSNGNGRTVQFRSTAEPDGFGERHLLATIYLSEGSDGGQLLASDEMEEVGYEQEGGLVMYMLRPTDADPENNENNLPTNELGVARQDEDGNWQAPLKLAGMYLVSEERKKKAKEGDYRVPAMTGTPRGWRDMDPEDPDCCLYEVFLGEGPDGEEIPDDEALVFFRRKKVALRSSDAPRAKTAAEFLRA